MRDLNFRTLTADEIECRVGQVKSTKRGVGCSLLLYKDARVDMALLDEVVKPYNWKREHSRDNANCTVSLWDEEKQQWVSKEDTGTPSNTEAEKGLASDSFKRACFNWGIGRELYTAPFIWITLQDGEYYMQGTSYKVSPNVKFSVASISYDDKRQINVLRIIDGDGQTRFTAGQKPTPEPKEKGITVEQRFEQDKAATAAWFYQHPTEASATLEKFNTGEFSDLTKAQWGTIIAGMKQRNLIPV